MISIVIDPDLRYPDAADHFSPDERFPEYRLGHISPRPNPVYRAVRDLFVQAGLDTAHLGTADWNPLGEYVKPGSRVFLLCNFMQERRADESREDFFSRCSHGSVIRALADYVLIAAGDTGHVNIGNAPIQFCDWEAVLRDTEAREVLDFYASAGAPVTARDLRLRVTAATRLGAIRSVERRDETEGVHVRLDGDSLFAGQDAQRPRYRVMNYDPRRTQRFHEGGRHEYVIHREILESDVIVSAVKLKTHEKVGITCGIKGMVGTVAHKDSLPHHRYGPRTGAATNTRRRTRRSHGWRPACTSWCSAPHPTAAPAAPCAWGTKSCVAPSAAALRWSRAPGTATTPPGAWPRTWPASPSTPTQRASCTRPRSAASSCSPTG